MVSSVLYNKMFNAFHGIKFLSFNNHTSFFVQSHRTLLIEYYWRNKRCLCFDVKFVLISCAGGPRFFFNQGNYIYTKFHGKI